MLLALVFLCEPKEQRIALGNEESTNSLDGGARMFGGVPFGIIILLWLFGVLG